MAKAKYYLLTCDTLTGEEAERIGLVSIASTTTRCRTGHSRSPTQLAGGAQSAIRWTKQTLNNWYRAHGAFDASLAYEFFGFGGPDAREGLAVAHARSGAAVRRPHQRVARARVGPADAGRETGLAAVECPAPGRGARAKGVRVETLGIGSLTAGRVGLGCDNFGTRIDEERSAAGGAGRASTRA